MPRFGTVALSTRMVTVSPPEPPAGTVSPAGSKTALTPSGRPAAREGVKLCSSGERFMTVTVLETSQTSEPRSAKPRLTDAGRARAWTAFAAGRSMRPAPWERSGRSRSSALSMSAALTISGLQSGWSCLRSAAPPATWGVAMEVPEMAVCSSSRHWEDCQAVAHWLEQTENARGEHVGLDRVGLGRGAAGAEGGQGVQVVAGAHGQCRAGAAGRADGRV